MMGHNSKKLNEYVAIKRNKNVKTITTLKEALEKIKQLKTTYYFKRGSEHVSLPDSVGRELSEDIVAYYMSPAFDIAAMDGFAVHSEDVYPLKISGSVYAGDQRAEIKRGEAMAIATGAILPEGADAVLKIEDSEVKKSLLNGKKLKKWENVFRKGSDYHAEDRIFEKNHRIIPQSAALLYSLGVLPENGFEYILFVKIAHNTARGRHATLRGLGWGIYRETYLKIALYK